jgi:hypothetical protein
MKRLFKMAFFACGFIGLFVNLAFIFSFFNREAEVGSCPGSRQVACNLHTNMGRSTGENVRRKVGLIESIRFGSPLLKRTV